MCFYNFIPTIMSYEPKCPQCGEAFEVSSLLEKEIGDGHNSLAILTCDKCKLRITGRTIDELFNKIDFYKQRLKNPLPRKMNISIDIDSNGMNTQAEIKTSEELTVTEGLLAINIISRMLLSKFSRSLVLQTVIDAVSNRQFKYDDTIVCQEHTRAESKEGKKCPDSETHSKLE